MDTHLLIRGGWILINRRKGWTYVILACILICTLIWSVSAVSPAVGVSWDKYIPDDVDHPAKAEFKVEKGLGTLAPTIPVSGTRPLLVLLVASADTASVHDTGYFENLFFGNSPSVANYYTEVSYERFTYTQADVLGWYQSTYTTAEIAGDATKRSAMIQWAIQQTGASINFGEYDMNGDGSVTNEELTIYVITTGEAGEQGGAAVWGHHSKVGSVTCDGKTVEGEYSIAAEIHHNPVGCYAHELGHDLGLPDLYDTDGGSEGIGNYGLMGGGSWCGPTHMTAWEKTQLGWLTPIVAPVSGDYDIHDSETHAEAYLLWSDAHGDDEYFLVENRWRGSSYDSRWGYSGYLPDQGIIIYHIDEVQARPWFNTGKNNVNADEAHKGVDVECADFVTSHVIDADHLDRSTNRGCTNDLWDGTGYSFSDTSSPAKAIWNSGGASGISVSQLPAVGATMRTYLVTIVPSLPPTVTGITPTTGEQGSPVAITDLAGTGFITGATVALQRSGSTDIAATGVVVVSQTQITCRFDIPVAAATGAWNVVVTNTGGSVATLTNGFTIRADGPPVASFTSSPASPVVGVGVQFSDTSSNVPTAWSWNFGDGGLATEQNPHHLFTTTGTYTVELTVTNPDGSSSTAQTLTVAATPAASEQYSYVTKWGGISGTGTGQFTQPRGVAVDAGGNVYVVEYGNNRVQKFTSTGTFITKWGRNGGDGSSGTATGQFYHPEGIAVDSSGNIYVADTGNNRIQKFSSGGTFLAMWGSPGSGNGFFAGPAGIAVDGAGNIFVADYWNYRVQKFTSGGTFVATWGRQGTGSGEFVTPRAIAAGADGMVYVADTGNNRIQKFTSTGTFLKTWGFYGSGNGQFNSPQGIGVDTAGNVFVTDYQNSRAQKFRPDGTFLARWGGYGTGDGKFIGTVGIAVDAAGYVYVVDYGNNRAQKFSRLLVPPIANFTANATAGNAPLDVLFTDTSTGDGITGRAWDFNNDGIPDSTEQNPVHTYTAAGTFTVNLTVTNAGGTDSEVKTGYITVNAAPVVLTIPGQTNPPTDPNSDGLYEDLNGNAGLDFNDVQVFFREMEWIAANEPVALFDFNQNAGIDFNDIQLLFRRI
jgi:M6 family metalloprotease-like protein